MSNSSSVLKPMSPSDLKPATELARASSVRFPNESAEYRRAREALLAEEIELRRHIERVAEQRRKLPPGGEVTRRYAFEGEGGKVTLADLFGDKETLVIYSYMFGPQRERPCPSCTSYMSTWKRSCPTSSSAWRLSLPRAHRSSVSLQRRRRAAGRSTKSFRILQATTPATTSAPRTPMLPAITCSCAGTARSATSGPARWRCHRRSRSGSARRTGFRSALDRARHHTRGTRHGLVSEAELLASTRPASGTPLQTNFRSPAGCNSLLRRANLFTNQETGVCPRAPHERNFCFREHDATPRHLFNAHRSPAGHPARSVFGVRDQ